MKALLKDELDVLHNQSVRLERGHYESLVEAFPDVYGDFRLLRFLRKDKHQNPQSAAQRYRNFLRWREEFNVDEIRQRVEKHPFAPTHHISVVGDLFKNDFDVQQHDQPDTVAAILNVGNWKTDEVTNRIRQNELTVDDFLHYWTHTYESLHEKLYMVSMDRKRMMYVDVVADLFDCSISQFSPFFLTTVVKPWIKLTQANYPQTSKRIFFLRPPRIVSMIWNVVTPWASPTTVEKIQFHRDYKGSCYDFVQERI